MRKIVSIFAAGVFAWTAVLATSGALAQATSQRKVITRVMPHYPETARHMHVQGTVKVEVVVRANGMVKSTRVLGGSPILIKAAVDAVQQWKFAASLSETTEIVQLTFTDQ